MEILRPKSFTFSTTSQASSFMRMVSNSCWIFEKVFAFPYTFHCLIGLCVLGTIVYFICLTLCVNKLPFLQPFQRWWCHLHISICDHFRLQGHNLKKARALVWFPGERAMELTPMHSDTHPSPSLIL